MITDLSLIVNLQILPRSLTCVQAHLYIICCSYMTSVVGAVRKTWERLDMNKWMTETFCCRSVDKFRIQDDYMVQTQES